MTAPTDIVVIGTGGGGLTIAADLGLGGRPVVLADQPRFGAALEAVDAAGGIELTFRTSLTDTSSEARLAPVAATSVDPAAATESAELVIVCVPAFGHEPLAEMLASRWRDHQTVLWVGEPGGSFAAVAALRAIDRRVDVTFADTNTLPYYGALVSGPGTVGAIRKSGGTLIAALPSSRLDHVASVAAGVWPWVTAAENVWETLLLNFNAIDHVPAMLLNLGAIQQSNGTFTLWGAGGTHGVVRVIEALDDEYLVMRKALGIANETPYEDYLVGQGLAPRKGADLHETLQSSLLPTLQFRCGPNALDHRFVSEDVPYSLVLASSLGRELGVTTPVIDSLITLASVASGRDYAAEGKTLAEWGLDGAGVAGLRAAAEQGWW
ncbi:MAG: NAD/NADP octopine/nopaline dehydrogenase family protein [bacterium]|nr:NAD/NADP octopine/nopaline dehydrogenase family protein [bacterium]